MPILRLMAILFSATLLPHLMESIPKNELFVFDICEDPVLLTLQYDFAAGIQKIKCDDSRIIFEKLKPFWISCFGESG